MPNVLFLGRGTLKDQALKHLWPDRFCGPRLGDFEIRTFGFADGLDYRFDVGTTLPEIVAAVSASWKPDFVLLWSAEWLHLPLRVEACPIPTVLVVQDWDYWIDHTRFAVQACDLTITQGPGSMKAVEALGANRAAWCQFFGVLEPELDAVPPMAERDIDIMYSGYLDDYLAPERSMWVSRLAAMGKKHKVVIAGSYMSREEYARTTRRSKLVFCYHRHGEMSPRFAEALVGGALPLDSGAVTAEIVGNAPYGRFRPERLEQTAAELLSHPSEIDRMVARARAQLVREHGSHQRLAAMLKLAATVLESPPPRRRALELSPAELHRQAAVAAVVGLHRRQIEARNDVIALAVEEAQRAAALDGTSARAWTTLAGILGAALPSAPADEVKPRTQQALGAVAQALSIDPAYTMAHAAGWSLLQAAGQAGEALPYALSVVEAAQGAPELFDAACLLPRDAYFGRVVALEDVLLQQALKPSPESQRRFARAVATGSLMGIVDAQPPFVAAPLVTPVLAHGDADPTLLMQGARIARLLRRTGEQRQLLKRAVERLPTDPGVRIELMQALLAERMFAEAEQLFMHTGVLLKAVATLMPQATKLSSLVPCIVPGPARDWRLGLLKVRAALEDVNRLEELSRNVGPAVLPPLQALVQEHLEEVVELESRLRGARAKAAG